MRRLEKKNLFFFLLVVYPHKQQISNVTAKVTAFICSLGSLSAFISLLLRCQSTSAAIGWWQRMETERWNNSIERIKTCSAPEIECKHPSPWWGDFSKHNVAGFCQLMMIIYANNNHIRSWRFFESLMMAGPWLYHCKNSRKINRSESWPLCW